MLQSILQRELASIEASSTITIERIQSLEALILPSKSAELARARKELREVWAAVYARADSETLAYLDKIHRRVSTSAAQWQRIQRTKRAMPYLIYQLGPQRDDCASHLHWENLLLPVDDPWWASHLPPNSWGCGCVVRGVARFEYEKLLASGKVKTSAPNEEPVCIKDIRTGEMVEIPFGVSPGWAFNPGEGRGGV